MQDQLAQHTTAEPGETAYAGPITTWLTRALLVVATVACGVTFLVPSVLAGEEAMNGSARGTALVMLLIAVPLTYVGMAKAGSGSPLGLVVWMGGLAYVLYNAVMLCFGTPFNELFLLYVGMFSLALWSLLSLFSTVTPVVARGRVPARAVAVYMWVVVGLNTLAWLGLILPAMVAERPTAFLDDSGLTTNPVFVQDLAVWLPGMAVAALLLWRSHAWGLLVAGAGLVFWQVEAVGVAVDQWLSHRADPTSSVASEAGVWLFVVMFVVGLLPTWALLRRVPA